MQIIPYSSEHLSAAVDLFTASLRALRERAAILPDLLSDPAQAAEKLAGFLTPENALVALDGGRLVGYLGWWIVPGFRGTPFTGAFSPEFGHGAAAGQTARVYRALYAAASAGWARAGCQLHCLTLLAGNAEAERFWFENGFGMLLHDAIRPMAPLSAEQILAPIELRVRLAEPGDAAALAVLDAEHCRYYTQPPVCMVPRTPESEAALADFLVQEPNCIWLAQAADGPQAFMRFQRVSEGAARIVQSPQTIAITGAFTRPAWRGRGLAPALLDAALRGYAARGFTRMSVDYETINPQALAFWPRYFTPVAVSLVRVLEYI